MPRAALLALLALGLAMPAAPSQAQGSWRSQSSWSGGFANSYGRSYRTQNGGFVGSRQSNVTVPGGSVSSRSGVTLDPSGQYRTYTRQYYYGQNFGSRITSQSGQLPLQVLPRVQAVPPGADVWSVR